MLRNADRVQSFINQAQYIHSPANGYLDGSLPFTISNNVSVDVRARLNTRKEGTAGRGGWVMGMWGVGRGLEALHGQDGARAPA